MAGPLWAWIRGLKHWERVRRPPKPAQEDAAFQARIRAGQAWYERLQKALDELPNCQDAPTSEHDEDPSG
jgi:hypothetical protein